MIELTKYYPKIKVHLENGIYLFDSKSAMGKTRLAKELKKNAYYGENVISYTYNDFRFGYSLEDILVVGKYDLIMLDRYDMYKNYGGELIKQCGKDSIVLLDCKSELGYGLLCDFCTIEMTADTIEVVE